MEPLTNLLQVVSLPAFLALLGVSGIAGLVAVVSPQRFKVIVERSGRWIDTNKIVARLDKPVNVDQHVLRHTRVFGAVVLAAVAVLTFVYTNC